MPPSTLLSPLEYEFRLRLEMRRAERLLSTLCVVTFHHATSARSVRRIAEMIVESLGAVPQEVIFSIRRNDEAAILLTNTEKADALRAVEAAATSVGVLATAAVHCYPDDVVASLIDGKDASQLAFVAFDADQRPRDVVLKRWIDVLGALIALVGTAPIMVVAAFAVAVTSRGPVLFKQARIGRHGRKFFLFKFRTMYHGADEGFHREYVTTIIRSQRPSSAGGVPPASWKQLDDDPRITPVGRQLRRLKIDEFPQFFNVLRGDMSLVGPRPALSYEVALYQVWQLRRLLESVPGVTGLWQVTGDSHTTFDDMVRMDLHYIDRWSNRLDLKILLATARLLLERVPELLDAKRVAARKARSAPPKPVSAVVGQGKA